MSADYSARWRSVFGALDPAGTAADVAFLLRVLPLPEFRHVLAAPCGEGRVVRTLGEHG